MKQIILLSLIITFIQSAFAAAEKKELPPLDPKFMAVYPMVLVNNGSYIIASNLATYKAPHNVQLLYKLKVNEVSLIQLVRDAALVTIKPEAFNLQRMFRGEEFTVKADIYIGDYNKEGVLTYRGMDITFHKKLYQRELINLKPASTKQVYDMVKLPKNERIAVHRIEQAPSYDQFIILHDNIGCLLHFNTTKKVPKPIEVYYKLNYCGSMKPLYFNSESFK